MEKVIVIIGPTGVGKTKSSIELAKSFNGEIISGDSMQVYRTMDIGTAKIKPNEMEDIPHHLIDIKDVNEEYSVYEYQQKVRSLITDITNRGKLPIIVGGTGLYIKSVLYDYNFEAYDKEEVRNDLLTRFNDYSNEELHKYLSEIDYESSLKIHMNNRRRVLRAIEYYLINNQKISDNVSNQEHKLLYDVFLIGLTMERSKLYERINERVDTMVDEGLVSEVKSLYDANYDRNLQSIKAIGYKELYQYFDGNISLFKAIEDIKKASRNYAKRQYTFFNNQFDVHWFNVNLINFSETINELKKSVSKFISN